jgi:hypothetical protein
VVASAPMTNALITTSPIFHVDLPYVEVDPFCFYHHLICLMCVFNNLVVGSNPWPPACMALPKDVVSGAWWRCPRRNSVDRFCRTSIFEMSIQGIKMLDVTSTQRSSLLAVADILLHPLGQIHPT